LGFVFAHVAWSDETDRPGLKTTLPLSPDTLTPAHPVQIDLNPGQSLRVPFDCSNALGADAVIHLESLLEHSDPFLVVSSDEKVTWAGTTTFDQWQDDTQKQSIVVKNVGPNGGSVDVYNVNNLATESLKADLTIQCASITVYDFLFWNHVKDKEICPIGDDDEMCSNRGGCNDGACVCDSSRGIACEHLSSDIVMAKGEYEYELPSGKYHYYRIRVPPTFVGGYLSVSIDSDYPLVLLVRRGELPSKAVFDASNFGDWLRHQNETKIEVAILPGVSAPANPPSKGEQQHRFLQLAYMDGPSVRCPNMEKIDYKIPACSTPKVKRCEQECLACIECVETKSGACRFLCKQCSVCADAFLPCAESIDCFGETSKTCEDTCGLCMGCLDSNDPNCTACGCCGACLPWAAKCGPLSHTPAPPSYVFVAIYNHRFYYNDFYEAKLKVKIKLHADPTWQPPLPEWVDELYGKAPLQSVEALRNANDNYDGKHVYTINKVPGTVTVDVYADRVTLVHVLNLNLRNNVEARVNTTSGIVTHMLASSARPKTFFDFNHLAVAEGQTLKVVFPDNQNSMWYAIFAKQNGQATISVTSYYGEDSFPFTTGTFFIALLLVIGFVLWTRSWAGSHNGTAVEVEPLQYMRASETQESTLMDNSFRYPSFREDEGLSASVEQMHMHRGGAGVDDGI